VWLWAAKVLTHLFPGGASNAVAKGIELRPQELQCLVDDRAGRNRVNYAPSTPLREGVRSYFASSPRCLTDGLALNLLTSSVAYLLDVL
jgi:hypothetical protein